LQPQPQTKQIQTYSFDTFCLETQNAVQEGFTFDFESNENYPQQIGTTFSAVLTKLDKTEVKVEDEIITEIVTESAPSAETEVVPEAKRGRKPNSVKE
jgi:hypothetical protein